MARVIAADDVEIGLPEAEIGLIPGAGGTVSIPRRAGTPRLLELLLTGERMRATTALEWGLVDEVRPARRRCARSATAREVATG